MILLQTSLDIGANIPTHLRGWDVVIWALMTVLMTIFAAVFRYAILPKLIKKENKEVIKTVTKEEFDKLVTENEIVVNENNTIFKRFDHIEAALTDAVKQREWFNNSNMERLNKMSEQIQALTEKILEASLNALAANIYNTSCPTLTKMYCLVAFIKLGGNGEVLEFAIKDFLLANRTWWLSVYRKELENFKGAVNMEKYQDTLKYLKERIHT